MIIGGIIQAVLGVEAAGRQLEDIAKPLTAEDAEADEGRFEPESRDRAPERTGAGT